MLNQVTGGRSSCSNQGFLFRVLFRVWVDCQFCQMLSMSLARVVNKLGTGGSHVDCQFRGSVISRARSSCSRPKSFVTCETSGPAKPLGAAHPAAIRVRCLWCQMSNVDFEADRQQESQGPLILQQPGCNYITLQDHITIQECQVSGRWAGLVGPPGAAGPAAARAILK